jgi:hypothetical protein
MEFAYGVGGPAQWQRDIIIPPGMAFIYSFLPLFFDAQAAGRSPADGPKYPLRWCPGRCLLYSMIDRMRLKAMDETIN